MYAIFCRGECEAIQDIVVGKITTVGVFYSFDEYIKCLCADQSGKKLDKKHKMCGSRR